MDTPICDFVRGYAESGALRLHMPGHKGVGEMERLDLTEIDGADVLYHSCGIIRRSEENAAALFGAARTVYSVEGSSLSIRAMLHLALCHAARMGREAIIAAGRNAHKVFLNTAALLDFGIDWLWGENRENVAQCHISPAFLEGYLSTAEKKPAAVYVTSPDYLGNVADIAGLSAVCHAHDVLLLVDNAHGAYLRFLTQSLHPMDLGADLCCDSAHKTLPVLTGGGYLHISHRAPAWMAEEAETAMALFASTSPSYLILQSLDGVNPYLAASFAGELAAFLPLVDDLKSRLEEAGWRVSGAEPMKLTLRPKNKGYRGDSLAKLLEGEGIFAEFSDPDYLVLMLSPKNGLPALERLEKVLLSIPEQPALAEAAPPLTVPVKKATPRQVLYLPRKTLPAKDCLGKVLCDANVSCPPAIPVVACGEIIDENALAAFDYYGVESCTVVDV